MEARDGVGHGQIEARTRPPGSKINTKSAACPTGNRISEIDLKLVPRRVKEGQCEISKTIEKPVFLMFFEDLGGLGASYFMKIYKKCENSRWSVIFS